MRGCVSMLRTSFQLLFVFLCFSLLHQDAAGIECQPGEMATLDRSKCVSCPEGQYSSAKGDHIECNNCVSCGDYSKKIAACTKTSNTKCQCESGFQPIEEEQEKCFCDTGSGIKSENGENVCTKCKKGTFNKDDNSHCKPWTKCDSNGVLAAGNATHDVICVNLPKKNTDPTNISVFVTHISAATTTTTTFTKAAASTTQTRNSVHRTTPSIPVSGNSTMHSLWLVPLASVLALLLIQFAIIKLKLKACFHRNEKQMARQDSACGKPVEESGVEKML